jgi:hypothetical protein
MKTWIDLPDRLFRARARRRPAATRQVARLAVAVAPLDDIDADATDRLLRELTAASLLVQRGVARRVLVANGPGAPDLDAVRLLADTYDVVVEPIVRIGGGALDFVVRTRDDDRG